MTYTVIGRCGTSGRLGIAIATYSLAVGGYCPSIRAGVGAVSTQAFVNPGLGPLALRLMALGYRAEKVMAELAESDPEFDWRQIALIDRDGGAVAHTGRNTRPWSGHVTADGVVAMGNVLAGEAVVTAIAEGFEASAGEGLDERLLRALEAGRDAGGQQGADGHLPERSAGLLYMTGTNMPFSTSGSTRMRRRWTSSGGSTASTPPIFPITNCATAHRRRPRRRTAGRGNGGSECRCERSATAALRAARALTLCWKGKLRWIFDKGIIFCIVPGSLDTSLSHAAGLSDIAVCHA